MNKMKKKLFFFYLKNCVYLDYIIIFFLLQIYNLFLTYIVFKFLISYIEFKYLFVNILISWTKNYFE